MIRLKCGDTGSSWEKLNLYYGGARESAKLLSLRSKLKQMKRLIGYIVKTEDEITSKAVKAFLRSKLPEYMIPTHIVILEQWPLMPNGKIDRRALPEPVEDVSEEQRVYTPRDSLELQLQLLFERVLKRAPIGIDVSFFELGGDSLQALELLVQIEKATGKNLPLGTLYQSSTVETLAREVRDRSGANHWSSLVPLQTSGRRAPFFLLHTTPGDILGYGNLVYHLPSDQPCYGFQSLGLQNSELSHQSISDMAGYYVDLLRQSPTQRAWDYLGGWCYGGIVAVEMAESAEPRREGGVAGAA